MSFKDELQNMVDEKAAEERRARDTAKAPIPEATVNELAAFMAPIFKQSIKGSVAAKCFTYDVKTTLLKKLKRVNYRYAARAFWSIHATGVLSNPKINWENTYFPKNTPFFREVEHDMSPTDLYFASEAHLDQVFGAVKRLLEADGISVTYEKKWNGEYLSTLTFEAFVPCDSEGNIL